MLVAPPFLGVGGWPDDAVALPEDLAGRLPDVPIELLHGLADDAVPPLTRMPGRGWSRRSGCTASRVETTSWGTT